MNPITASPRSIERAIQRRAGWAVAAILGATLAAYFPALKAGFIWDDDGFVTRAGLRSWQGLWRIWFEPGATEQYYPVLHSVFWLEHGLWGEAALGYHWANIVLHAAAACLFVLVLRRLWGVGKEARVPAAGAWLAGMLFALHPVCVESVAWITEQKNTLSTVFYLLAALAYLRFDEPREGRRGLTSYWLATGWFILALLSKTVTVTLPAALLVVGWWRRGRLSWRRDGVPLAPWLALSAAAGLVTVWVERTFIGAQGAAFALGFTSRWLLVGRQIWFYMGKLVWPANLIFIYPRWRMEAAAWWQGGYLLGVVALTAALWWWRRRSRAPLAAWLFFVGSLFPTLGFFNVYAFIFSYVADHWTYLASLGAFALAAAGLARALAAAPVAIARAGRMLVLLGLTGLGVLTWRQCRMYRNAETLYRATLDRNSSCWMAHNNLGAILTRSDRAAEALEQFDAALPLAPPFAEIQFNRGDALVMLGRLPEAVWAYEAAIRLQPAYAAAHANLGHALLAMGRLGGAILHYEQALRFHPDDADSEANLGYALAHTDRLPEAVFHYERALALRPGFPEAHNNLGTALARLGRLPEAIVEFREAVRLKPDNPDNHRNLGFALRDLGKDEEAAAQFEAAARRGTNR
jgi:tetratricopeptide (TPR) repeat protein